METTEELTVRAIPNTWNIEFTETGRKRYDEVRAFLVKLWDDAETDEEMVRATEIRNEFLDRMSYLQGYGGWKENGGAKNYRVTLSYDWAQLSFGVLWERRNKDGFYEFAFNGGLIWHGGPGDPLTVSLTPQWWGIHT